MSTPITIIPTLSSASSSLHTSATPTALSRISAFTESGEAFPSADDGRRAKTQSYPKSSFSMSESDLAILEDRVRQEGGTSASPFTSRYPNTFISPANTSISQTVSSMSHSRSLMLHSYSSHAPVTVPKHLHGTDVDCHEIGVAEIPESPRGGLTGRDTICKRVLHRCPESQPVGLTDRVTVG